LNLIKTASFLIQDEYFFIELTTKSKDIYISIEISILRYRNTALKWSLIKKEWMELAAILKKDF